MAAYYNTMKICFNFNFRAILITTDKELDQLQNSCISLPTSTVPVVAPHV